MDGGGAEREEEAAVPVPARCAALHRSLNECHRRVRGDRIRDASCRHLNRALAECVVSSFCPEEAELVRSMCSSAGTSLKRAQCERAKLELSVCLSSHQTAATPPPTS